MSYYPPLSAQFLIGAVQISRPAAPRKVTMDSSALDVMTDMRRVYAAVIQPYVTMELANTYMIQRGIRSLFVMNQDHLLEGIITATDILGEKPLRFIQERRIKHSEILVSDIMTPLEKLEAIPIEEVEKAKVGNVVASLRDSGRQHTLVIRRCVNATATICGIFSLTQLEKQLGVAIIPTNLARTFAEIETRLIAN
ncbi:CBS domain-containing protein [Nitrosomonas cryotolerans]|uniref:CBS domain n=2 Tax=Nitrosomonas cryotolerans TaxID=44575 RepID=A0A1N6J8S4_9PROT|nr:CBS domain-containing protein [Nitrosomonas cryotolerans]SIO40625.1 CBS domain [Nitrosomonas cryotolerans ATCC 49181]